MSNFFRKDDLVTKVELGEKLWELEGYVSKYLRTFGLKDGILEDAVQEALKQIVDKKYDAELVALGVPQERIRHYGFAFAGKNVLIGAE